MAVGKNGLATVGRFGTNAGGGKISHREWVSSPRSSLLPTPTQPMIFFKSTTPAWLPSLIALLLGLVTASAQDREGSALLRDARQQITAYHAGQPESQRQLRVVYFVPSDRDPLPNHAERLDRILDDVNNFYRDGFRRFGQDGGGLPLEKKDGKLVLHLVRGKLPAAGYQYESGQITTAEIRAALQGTVDLARDHVLVLYALCHKEADGRYVFNAPYYGDGSSSNQRGLCHAADCELLDPLLLTAKDRDMVYTEHYYPRVEQTVAKFNSWYLGGIAHELGHGLGLPHDNGSRQEQGFGVSLMGRGNHHYREDLWGGETPAYLSRATALRLASHPLVTRSEHDRAEPADGYFDTLAFADEGGGVKITGTVSATVPAYAVIAHLWPVKEKSDHGAITYPVVLKDRNLKLELTGLRREPYHLKLSILHVNGAATNEQFQLTNNPEGKLDIPPLTAEWLVDRAEFNLTRGKPKALEYVSDEVIATTPTPESKRKLRVLRTLLEPPAIADLAAIRDSEAYLSDVAWTDAQVGWGQPRRNSFWFNETFPTGAFLTLNGAFHDKGLYAHSPSRYAFAVDRKWKLFTATIGLRDGASPNGSGIFTVLGDGKELHRSGKLRAGEREFVSVDIAEVSSLELRTEGGDGNSQSSWTIWADPKVRR